MEWSGWPPKKLDKAQNVALCAIPPVWKTTPIKIMQKEAATPPIEHTLHYLCELASLRLHRLEPLHPIRLRIKNAHSTTDPTQLEKIAQTCSPITQYSDPLVDLDPWEEHFFGGTQNVFQSTRGTRDKKKASQNFKSWIETLDRKDILVYSDGSQEVDQNGTTTGPGVAWVFKWTDRWLGMNRFSLGANAEVYNAEALAILRGLEAAIARPMARLAPGIHICLDNLSVARNAGKGSSQAAFKKFRDAAKGWLYTGKRLTVQWIPAQTRIEGNEIADK